MDGKISIIIPVYNVSSYIDRCVKRILNQTYNNYEVILVDDGSTDDSYTKILDWSRKYPEKIRVFSQNNMGAGPARNRGLDEAISEYITFIDSDDYINNDYLENLKKILRDMMW